MNFSRLVQQDTSVIGSVIGSVVVPRAIVSFNLMYFESCFNNFSFFVSGFHFSPDWYFWYLREPRVRLISNYRIGYGDLYDLESPAVNQFQNYIDITSENV